MRVIFCPTHVIEGGVWGWGGGWGVVGVGGGLNKWLTLLFLEHLELMRRPLNTIRRVSSYLISTTTQNGLSSDIR